MKQRIRLTESDLHNIIKESVRRILIEDKPRPNSLQTAIDKLYTPEEAEELGFAIPKEHQSWGNDEFIEPTPEEEQNAEVGYKVFEYRGGNPNLLYPPMVNNQDGAPTPIDKWIPCGAPEIVGYTRTHKKPQVITKNNKLLAWRPGWHLGKVPFASQFFARTTDNKKLGIKSKPLMYEGGYIIRDTLLFAETLFIKGDDWTSKSLENGTNKKTGNYNKAFGGVPAIPKYASYSFQTNPSPSSADWWITGAMKVKGILKPEEVNAINNKHGLPNIHFWPQRKIDAYRKQVYQQELQQV